MFVVVNNELYHHGVKGMKWGVRKDRKAAKQQYRKRKDDAFNEYERTIASIEKPYRRGQTLSKADIDREAAAEKKYSDAIRDAKNEYKATKSAKKQEVKAAKKAAKAPHEDYQRAHSKKKVTKMSDKELRDVNNRLQMEKQFSQLTEKKKSAGRKFVSGVLATAATTVATGYAVKYMKKGIEYLAK